MRKMKRLITLLMTVVMMMAMSITAFAATGTEQGSNNNLTTVTITNFPDSAIGKAVFAYQFASIADDNTIEIEKWASDAGYTGRVVTKDANGNVDPSPFEMDPSVANALDDAFESPTDNNVPTATVANNKTATFNLPAGAYLFRVSDNSNIYNAMVVVTITADGTGKYVRNNVAQSIKAKSEPKTVDKVEDEKFTATNKKVKFDITTTIPYVKPNETLKTFTLFDEVEGGKYDANNGKLNVVITYADNSTETREATINETASGYKFELDLSDIVKEKASSSEDANDGHAANFRANEKIKFTYYGIATTLQFKNTAYTKTPHNNNDVNIEKTTIYSYTAALQVSKTGTEDDQNVPLAGAKFVIYRNVGTDEEPELEYATLDTNNYLTGWTDDKNAASKIVTALNNDKTAAVATAYGFDRGDVHTDSETGEETFVDAEYYFEEVEAPATWTINPEPKQAIWTEEVDANVYKNLAEADGEYIGKASLNDTKLIQLPFTGGMGTTIFTILGVAIMAMAAALFFATKKNHN